MKNLKMISLIAVLILSVACSTSIRNDDEVTLRVNSYTVDCMGVVEGKCLLVQEGNKIGSPEWELFYFEDSIEKFRYEPGYIYTLLVRKTEIENPPQDASSFRYELLRILAKEKV